MNREESQTTFGYSAHGNQEMLLGENYSLCSSYLTILRSEISSHHQHVGSQLEILGTLCSR